MKKRFNVTGPCNSKKHFMVDIDKKLKIIENMIHRGEYFVINRPRQYGKTTILSQLSKRLANTYLVIRISFEGIGDNIFKCEETFSSRILSIMSRALRMINSEKSLELETLSKDVKDLDMLSEALTTFISNSEKPVILLIDEVDKSSNNQLFLSFLGMLRNKFIMANDELDYTFLSVILAGVHDVKNLELKIRDDRETKFNSPWNIAVNFNVDMTFNSKEIDTMLKAYEKENSLEMNTEKLSEKLYFYTSGYPFLVSRICQIIDENIFHENKNPWTLETIDKAVKILLGESNTLFESVIKNLENNKEFKEFIERIILLGEEIVYVPSEATISLGILYGIIKEETNKCKVHNRIFEQYIYNHLSAKKIVENNTITNYNYRNNFLTEDNGLDFEKVLLKYQQFMKEQYSHRDERFIEREGRLLFMAFIKPIINGVGFDFKEVQVSEEKRLDVVVTYNQHKYISELKIWRGEEQHRKGIRQLWDYLDIKGLNKGYLVIYDFNKNKQYKSEILQFNGKEIYIIWV